jgi:hypothetical protein
MRTNDPLCPGDASAAYRSHLRRHSNMLDEQPFCWAMCLRGDFAQHTAVVQPGGQTRGGYSFTAPGVIDWMDLCHPVAAPSHNSRPPIHRGGGRRSSRCKGDVQDERGIALGSRVSIAADAQRRRAHRASCALPPHHAHYLERQTTLAACMCIFHWVCAEERCTMLERCHHTAPAMALPTIRALRALPIWPPRAATSASAVFVRLEQACVFQDFMDGRTRPACLHLLGAAPEDGEGGAAATRLVA